MKIHLPNKFSLVTIATIKALFLLTSCQASDNPDKLAYLPRSGDEAIIFINRFKTNDYEKGKQIMVEGFSTAMQKSGQTRRTYFLDNPDSHEVMAISFFHRDSSTSEWLEDTERQEVLSELEPLFREPQYVQGLTVEEVHDTK